MDRLLKLLSQNAKYTTEQLAVMLNESEEDIKSRIDKYEKSGVITGYKALINWDKVSDENVSAIIELKVTPQKGTGFDLIANRVKEFDEVESVYLMAGSYDLSVMVRGDSIQEIARFVAQRLSTLDFVVSTATHFVLSRYKDGGLILCDNEQEKRSMIL